MLLESFLQNVRNQLGKSYSECDCIGVIKNALGITFSGSNWLYRSTANSSKYKYLRHRKQITKDCEIPDGAIVFKVDYNTQPVGYKTTPDAYHVGVYMGDGVVIHSSPKTGVRVETFQRSKWQEFGYMKQVELTAPKEAGAVIVSDYSDMTDRQLLEYAVHMLEGLQ